METITIDICYQEEDGKKIYDFEAMVEDFEMKLSELDDSVVVMCSVQTK